MFVSHKTHFTRNLLEHPYTVYQKKHKTLRHLWVFESCIAINCFGACLVPENKTIFGGQPEKGTDQPTPTNHDLTESKGNVGDPKVLVRRDKYFWIDFPIYHQNQLC